MTTTSVRELQRNTKTVLGRLRGNKGGIMIMRNNKAVGILLSNKAYDNLQSEKVITRKELLQIIKEGDVDYKNGNYRRITSAEDLLKM